ncbi:MAG: ABC transporter substrate-binding protein [Elusimicrobia bacterium]|nr:ABC transporter substrate-binding protein [Elusimicrobiota bacterium]
MTKILKIFTVISAVVFSAPAGAAAGGQYPRRIVSLVPVITEELFLLGLGDSIVGVTVYCERPEEAGRREKVGTVTKANIEKIVSLKPDIVFTADLTDRQQVLKMKALGIEVSDSFSYKNKNFGQICENFLELGKLVGREKEAADIISSAERKLNEVKKKTEGPDRPGVIVQIGARPLWVASGSSFMNGLVEFAGGVNLGPEGESGSYSREKVVEDDPDVIIIVTMGISGEDEKSVWEKYDTIGAVKNGRIYIMDSDRVCSPTPESYIEVLEEIAGFLHPGIKL